MRNSSAVVKTLVCLVVLTAITIPLHASVVLTTPPNYPGGLYNIMEGSTLDFTYQFTNDTGSPVDINYVSISWGFVSGDPTDVITKMVFDATNCWGTVDSNASCTFTWTMVTDSADSGPMLDGLSGVSGGLGNYITNISFSSVSQQVYVSDTPEPGTLLLLGSSVVGLAGVLRNKLTR